jgi:hypothetical protein
MNEQVINQVADAKAREINRAVANETETTRSKRPNADTIVYRFLWRWAVANGIDPHVDGDCDNDALLRTYAERYALRQ